MTWEDGFRENTRQVCSFALQYESLAKQKIPGFSGFDQIRFGFPTWHWGEFSLLAMVPGSYVERLSEFRAIARTIEQESAKLGEELFIITMVSEGACLDTIKYDYRYRILPSGHLVKA